MLTFGVRFLWLLRTPRFLRRGDHGNGTVKATDIHGARGADRRPAAGADILARAAGLLGERSAEAAVRSSAADGKAAELIAVDQDIGQTVFQHEVKQIVAGLGGAPSVALAVAHDQTVGFGSSLEALVVVGVSTTAIMDTVDEVEVMAHLMKERGADVLDGSRKRPRADVDFVGLAVLGDPSIVPQGEVTISLRRGLNGDGRS